jgi:hypothetical protein
MPDEPPFNSAWSVLNEQARSPWKRGQQMTPNRANEPPSDCRDPRWRGIRYQGGCHPCHMCDACVREMEDRAEREGWNV